MISLYTHAIAAAVAASVAFGAAWTIQNWRIDANEKHHIAIHAAQERELHALEQKRQTAVALAQNAAAARAQDLRRSAAESRDALDGLRTSTDAALLSASADHATCIDRAATTSRLLNQCGAAYQDLGERADRHVSDVKTLMDAWPR